MCCLFLSFLERQLDLDRYWQRWILLHLLERHPRKWQVCCANGTTHSEALDVHRRATRPSSIVVPRSSPSSPPSTSPWSSTSRPTTAPSPVWSACGARCVGICGSQTLFDGYCYSSRPTSSWPTIDLYLNGLYISLPPDLYIIEQVSSKDSRIYYCLGISKIPSSIGVCAVLDRESLVSDHHWCCRPSWLHRRSRQGERPHWFCYSYLCLPRYAFFLWTMFLAEVVGGINETVFKPVDVMGSLEYIIFGALVVIIIVICICDLCKYASTSPLTG